MLNKSCYTWLVVAIAAGVVTGCNATAGHQPSENVGENDYPPINPNEKYFKPGPVLATTDDVELDQRYNYHQDVIDAHQFSYTIRDNEAMHREIHEITGLVLPTDSGSSKPKVLKAYNYQEMSLPEKFDGRAAGVGLPPIRNQGQCGSCWAFGTTAAVEAAIAKFDGKLVDLSEQYVLDCSGQGTCGGGFWAYNAYTKSGGVMEASYPYVGYDTSCKSNSVQHPYKIESYHGIPDHDINAIKAAIYQYGAVGVTMAVCGSFPGYGGGVYDSNECNYVGSNHIVALVGWDDTMSHKKGKGVWIMRNSWGTSWGDKGYAYMAYGTAGIEENGTYVIYKPIDPTDTDKDGVLDVYDNCKTNPNQDQADVDQDGSGDACDTKFDAFEKPLTLSDDDSRKIDLGFSFPFYGTVYSSVNINSDGNITLGAADSQSTDRTASRFLTNAPRIAPLYADLNPAAGGKVTYGKTSPTSFFVKYDNVPLYGSSGGNSARVTIDTTGKIAMVIGGVSSTDYVVGVSKGGQGNAASESDLSAASGEIGMGGTKAVFQSFAKGKAFDLTGKTLVFTTNNTPGPGPGPGPDPQPDPGGTETTISLGDDDTKTVQLGFSFPYFGKTYTDVHVNADGNLTFGSGDGETAERSASRFLTGAPRIGVLYGDLDPSATGTVSYRHDAPDSITITFKGVPLYGGGSSAGSTASVTLDSKGQIKLAYGSVSGSAYIAGLSAGGSGNSGSTLDLSAAGSVVGYGGSSTLYEVFGSGKAFDLSGKTITFTTDSKVDPDPGPSPDPNVPADTSVQLGDDDSKVIDLGFSFPFFSQSYSKVYVNSDGNLTFGAGDSSSSDRNATRFLTGAPRIAPLFTDLDPSKGGGVSVHHDDASTVTITYTAVPAWGQSGGNTVSVTLKSDGTVAISPSEVTAGSFIIGVSKGGSGNTASEVDLLSGDVLHYSGKGAVYQSFGDWPFVLDGSKIVITK